MKIVRVGVLSAIVRYRSSAALILYDILLWSRVEVAEGRDGKRYAHIRRNSTRYLDTKRLS